MERNLLFCSAGRRATLLQDFKKSLNGSGRIIATDNSPVAPALYFADSIYKVPRITVPEYSSIVLDICKKEKVKAITTLIDPEIEILARNSKLYQDNNIITLCPNEHSAHLCFDKYEMFKYMRNKGVRTVLTYNTLDSFESALKNGEISFPVFMKPISGSGSVGAHRVENMKQLVADWNEGSFEYIIQELMVGGDCDADVYVDVFSHKPVAAFSKRKIETKIGGASKTISFKDHKLFDFIGQVCDAIELNGPCDMDFFYKNGEYYLSEINPRFGGAYLHAYGAGVDFVKLIMNNIDGKTNLSIIGEYDEDILMMMYDAVVIRKKEDLMEGDFSLL